MGVQCPAVVGMGRGNMNFSVSIRQSDDVSIVEMKGHLTSFELAAMREAIQGLLKQGRTNILLNLRGLQYLDSSGVGELVRNYMSVVKRGGTMKVVGLGPKVEEILKITQLHRVFQEFPDERSAMESFPTSGPSNRI
jgi:anti-sigma B factor antagonist